MSPDVCVPGVEPIPEAGRPGRWSFPPSPASDKKTQKKQTLFFERHTLVSFFNYEITEMTSFPSLGTRSHREDPVAAGDTAGAWRTPRVSPARGTNAAGPELCTPGVQVGSSAVGLKMRGSLRERNRV